MPSESLRVTPTHLHALAAKHSLAAAELDAAVDLVAGVHEDIRVSHGVIASATAGVVESIERTRRAAGRDISEGSVSLGGDLDAAALAYLTTDGAGAVRIDGVAR